jgi:hypothetical protein
MIKLTYENIVNYWKEKFPEFVSSKEYDSDNEEIQYLFFADFSRYLLDKINMFDESDTTIQKTFTILNHALNDGADLKTQELLVVEILEALTISEKGVKLGKKLLKDAAASDFEEVLKWFTPPVNN